MTENSYDLPDECWEFIFNFIDHHHFDSISLVCKRFFTITNHLRQTLTISNPSLQFLPQFFLRFRNLKEVVIREIHADLNRVVCQIAHSGLNLETLNISNNKCLPVHGLKQLSFRMQSLRCLNCSRLWILKDDDLCSIALLFPLIEELDLSYPDYRYSREIDPISDNSGAVTDSGILALSTDLKKLRKINLSGNHFITDRSLQVLMLNCVFLREIDVRECAFLTQNGIGLTMRNCPNLVSLSAYGLGFRSIDLFFMQSFAYAKGLCVLELENSKISDELLFSVAESCLPLKKLNLSKCQNFTFAGLLLMLNKYQHLEHLELEAAGFLTDQSICELSKFFSQLTFINLNICSKLSNSTISTLAKNCPLLNVIKMKEANLGEEELVMDSVVNARVKSLNLAWNCKLSNNCIQRFASSFPNLEFVKLSYSCGVTEEGIVGMLKSCPKIRHLEINGLKGMKHLGIGLELPKLEVLLAKRSGISDVALEMIGKRCQRLLHLDLEGCLNVTVRGVKQVVENCKGLREINLMRCKIVNVDIVSWMVFSRPSLRKIIPPIGFVPTESQRNFFLRHGCLVCDGELS